MNCKPEELAPRGFGQAGKPVSELHEVNWRSLHFSSNLFTKPPPSLVYMVDLYIDWGSYADNLTPLPLYGNSLSFDVMAESQGNIELMYDPLHGWIPIIDHLHRTNPTVHWCMSHVYDFATLWNRAELAVQQHLKLPRRYSHDDLRFRKAWLAGKVDDIKPRLTDRQRRNLKKLKQHKLATAAQVRQPSHRLSEDTGTAESPQQSSIDMPETVAAEVSAVPPMLESGLAFALPRCVPAAAQSLCADPCTIRTPIDVSRRPRSPRAVQAAVSGGVVLAGSTFGGEPSWWSEPDEVEGNSVHNGAGAAAGEGGGEGVGEGEPGFVVGEDFSALFSGEMAQSLEELAGILYAAQCGVQRSTAAE